MARLIGIDHPLVRLVTANILHLRLVERRLPFLLAVVREAQCMSPDPAPARNDIILRLFFDSSDMLVIDLCSLRERTAKRGLFTRLKQHTNLLRRLRPADFDVEWMRIDGWPAEAQEASLEEERRRLADRYNAHFDWIFPAGDPVGHEHVDALIERFLADTKPTELDRNKARAHRYEEKPEIAAASAQTLEQVQQQVETFKRYFGSVFSLLTGSDYSMDSPAFSADVVETARDVADLILLGSINEATATYGLAEPRYWSLRDEFYRTGGKLT